MKTKLLWSASLLTSWQAGALPTLTARSADWQPSRCGLRPWQALALAAKPLQQALPSA